MLEAQQIRGQPPPLHELLRVAGVAGSGTVLGELFPGTGLGWQTMLRAKDNARTTARISETGEESGSGPASSWPTPAARSSGSSPGDSTRRSGH